MITTINYPEKDWPQGTILTSNSIVKMFEHFFETKVPAEFDTTQLLDLKWTPAEVTQVFLNNMHSPIEGIKWLESSDTWHNTHIKDGADEVKYVKD